VPGLRTRRATFVFVGSVCVALAVASPDPVPPEPEAVAVAAAAFVCVTAPLSPGLATRTETFVLLGATWLVTAVAVAVGDAAGCVLELVAIAVAFALFVWLTVPLVPGAPTLTSTFLFFG
jgi:hypothetical protein